MVMTCMSPRWLALMLLPLACAASSPGVPPAAAPLESTAEPPPASGERDAPLRRAESFTPVEGPTASAVPALLAAAKGDGLIVSRAEGLVLLDAQLRTLAVLSPERGRHLRLVGDQLYFFTRKRPVLRVLDLTAGTTRTIAELPRLRDPCFGSGRPADPLDFVQSRADLVVEAGALCFDIMDRDTDMATLVRNYRVDLATATLEQRTVQYDDLNGNCGVRDETVQPRLCTPTTRNNVIELQSSSGRWAYYPDVARGEAGDQLHALATVVDRKDRRTFAVMARKLRQLRAGADTPISACMVPGDAAAAWLGASDVLVIEGCRDALTVVRPPERVEHLLVDDFVVLPRP